MIFPNIAKVDAFLVSAVDQHIVHLGDLQMHRSRLPLVQGDYQLYIRASNYGRERLYLPIMLLSAEALYTKSNTEYLIFGGISMGFATLAIYNLMDVSMPSMDGYETVRHIRTHKQLSKVPVIALTAHVMVGERERCLAAGMDDYLSKPFEREQLAKRVLYWVELQCK